MRAMWVLAPLVMSLVAITTASGETTGAGLDRPELANSATALTSGPAHKVVHVRVQRTPAKLRPVSARAHRPVMQSQAPRHRPTVKAARSKPANFRSVSAASHPTFKTSKRKLAVVKRRSVAARVGSVRAASGRVLSHAHPGEHRMVIQVTQNDPALMNLALNNAQNLTKHYAGQGQRLRIEFVAYGPGLHMLRADSSPVKERILGLAKQTPEISFSACGNTMSAQGKQENKEIMLLPEAGVVPTGIARIVELQEEGWTYVRP
jgi:uncharacterized protein